MTTAIPVLAADGISVRYGRVVVLHEASISFNPGEMVAVAGPNGAGKTTLLRALAGVVPVDGGRVTLRGQSLGSMSRRALAKDLCYLPQETWTEFGVSAIDVVRLGRYAHVGPFRALDAADHAAIRDAMERTDIVHLSRRSLPTLSGGERRRVYLARALAQQAPVLVLDEPITTLDVGHACAVLDLLATWAAEGRTVILSVHDLTLARRGPTRAVLLDEGRVVADGSPAEVLTGAAARAAFGVPLVARDDPAAIVPL